MSTRFFKIHDRYAVVFPGWLEFYYGKDGCGSIDARKSYVGWGGGFKIHDRYAVVFPGWLEFYDGKDDCGSIDARKSCWMGWRPSESKSGIS